MSLQLLMSSCTDGRTPCPADSRGSRKQRKSTQNVGGWESVITKRVNMKENLKMKGGSVKTGATKTDRSKK